MITNMWAKLGGKGRDEVHPLICHMLDVGAVADVLVRRYLSGSTREWLAKGLGVTVEAMPVWAGFIASVHDIGKATPAFQAYSYRDHRGVFNGLQAAGFSFEGIYLADLGSQPRHDVLGRAILPGLLSEQ